MKKFVLVNILLVLSIAIMLTGCGKIIDIDTETIETTETNNETIVETKTEYFRLAVAEELNDSEESIIIDELNKRFGKTIDKNSFMIYSTNSVYLYEASFNFAGSKEVNYIYIWKETSGWNSTKVFSQRSENAFHDTLDNICLSHDDCYDLPVINSKAITNRILNSNGESRIIYTEKLIEKYEFEGDYFITALILTEQDNIYTIKTCDSIYKNNSKAYYDENGYYKIESFFCDNNEAKTISYKDALAIYKSFYGKDAVLERKAYSGVYSYLDYDKASDSFVKLSCHCGDITTNYSTYYVKNVELKDNKLVVETFKVDYTYSETNEKYSAMGINGIINVDAAKIEDDKYIIRDYFMSNYGNSLKTSKTLVFKLEGSSYVLKSVNNN